MSRHNGQSTKLQAIATQPEVIALLQHYHIPCDPLALTLSTEMMITLLLHLHQQLQELGRIILVETSNNLVVDQDNQRYEQVVAPSQEPQMVDLPVEVY